MFAKLLTSLIRPLNMYLKQTWDSEIPEHVEILWQKRSLFISFIAFSGQHLCVVAVRSKMAVQPVGAFRSLCSLELTSVVPSYRLFVCTCYQLSRGTSTHREPCTAPLNLRTMWSSSTLNHITHPDEYTSRLVVVIRDTFERDIYLLRYLFIEVFIYWLSPHLFIYCCLHLDHGSLSVELWPSSHYPSSTTKD